MRCLGCGESSWYLTERWIESSVQKDKPFRRWVSISLKVTMFECSGCHRTSADEDLLDDIVKRIMEASDKSLSGNPPSQR